jgi:hypothetical protein
LTTAKIWLIALCLPISTLTFSQSKIDSLLGKLDPQKWSAAFERKADKLQQKIISSSQKTLNRLQKQEEKIYRKMLKGKDSLQAKAALASMKEKYGRMSQKLQTLTASGDRPLYLPKLDTLTTALKFLDDNGVAGKVKDAISNAEVLQDKFSKAQEIQNFISERRQQLKQQLENLGMLKELKQINKEAYYYAAQINEYKEILKDSKKAERKAIELLSNTKVFKDFMRKNSQLAAIFGMPGSGNDPLNMPSLTGLQSRAQINGLLQQQIAVGGPDAQAQFRQSLQQVQTTMNALKDKVLKSGGNTGDDALPDFKPNTQKSKTFFQRIEYSTNLQTQKSTYFFPTTTDIGLSAGYKLNDKSVIGIGASYKMGLGRGWNNIRFSNEGIGLRTFIDWKIKGSFFLSGGYEQNYRSSFTEFSQLKNESAWQQSGLIGISKTISVKSKFFKKTKMQLMWDMLSYQQVPRTEPLVFRLGYTFK